MARFSTLKTTLIIALPVCNRAELQVDVMSEQSPTEHFRRVVLRLVEEWTEERLRLSRFLHDEIAQFLSGAGLQLDILRMDLEPQFPDIGTRTTEIQQILEQLVNRVRSLSYDLNPEVLDRTGLGPAMERLIERSRGLYPGEINFSQDKSIGAPPLVLFSAYRVADEAVKNAIRHSGSSRIDVTVQAANRELALEVKDNGRGFDLEDARLRPRGIGLILMDHFAAKAGLKLAITANRGGGQGVSVRLTGP